MVLQLAAEEPEGAPWRAEPLSVVAAALIRPGPDQGRDANGRGVVLALDGRSSSGKTTLAERLRAATPGAAVVHTDDIAWRHSRFGWTGPLTDGVLMPFRRGEPVSYRPPGWDGRQGSIEIPAGCPVLIVEGVGSGRAELTPLIDSLVWVQADQQEAERRSLARIGQPGGPRTAADHRDWMAEEDPFLAAERPWERADLLVAGTPQVTHNLEAELVVASPPPAGG